MTAGKSMTVSSKGAEYEEILELAVSISQVTHILPYLTRSGRMDASVVPSKTTASW